MITAGPASGTASWSTKKMPVPTVAPTPNIVSWKVPKLPLELRALVRALLLAGSACAGSAGCRGESVAVSVMVVPRRVRPHRQRGCQSADLTRLG